MLSLAVTTFERFDWTLESISRVRDDQRIDEIVICDDASADDSFERLEKAFASEPRVRLFRNPENLGPYRNKRQAVEHCADGWVLLFDSDNILFPGYLDAVEAVKPWDEGTAYLPSFAEPSFDYRRFVGLDVSRQNAGGLMTQPLFDTAMNTANHVFFREAYLDAWAGDIEPLTYEAMYQNFCWLDAGYRMTFVPGMHYFHRIHDQSYFWTHDGQGKRMEHDVRTLMESLR